MYVTSYGKVEIRIIQHLFSQIKDRSFKIGKSA
jgi:hypothetical protein